MARAGKNDRRSGRGWPPDPGKSPFPCPVAPKECHFPQSFFQKGCSCPTYSIGSAPPTLGFHRLWSVRALTFDSPPPQFPGNNDVPAPKWGCHLDVCFGGCHLDVCFGGCHLVGSHLISRMTRSWRKQFKRSRNPGTLRFPCRGLDVHFPGILTQSHDCEVGNIGFSPKWRTGPGSGADREIT